MILAAILLLAALGHIFFWIGLINRIHAFGWPRMPVKLASVAFLLAIPLGLILWIEPLSDVYRTNNDLAKFRVDAPFFANYTLLMSLFGAWALIVWGRRKILGDPEAIAHPVSVEVHDLEAEMHEPLAATTWARAWRKLPGNQAWTLAIESHELSLPRLPRALRGLKIAHLTDLHFTGHTSRAYFEHVVERVNAAEPDLICITGDLLDAPQCLDWIPQTFGRLRSKHGSFYILGNHDSRCGNLPRLHRLMADAGILDVGGAWRTIKIAGKSIILAGIECPWFGPAADFKHLPESLGNERIFRILLSHTPDRIKAALQHDFDLMLAGHTHGGQFAPPIIGPVFSPSLYGVRFCGGTFRRGNTTMHVSRGVSSEIPWRWNARPELSFLTLQPKPGQAAEANEESTEMAIDPVCTLADALET